MAVPVSIALLALVLRSVDLDKALSLMLDANPALLLAGLMAVFFEALFKSLKLKVMASTRGRCSLTDAAAVYLIGIPLGAVTPGKAGDALKLYNLSQRARIPLASSLAIGLLERLIDLVTTLVLALAGVIFIMTRHSVDRMVLITLGLSALAVFFLVAALSQRRLLSVLHMIYQRIAPAALRSNLNGTMETFLSTIASIIHSPAILSAVLFAFLSCLAISVRSFLLGSALGMNLPVFYFVLLIPIVSLVELLPISVLGFGTREYSTIWLFWVFGVSSEQSFSLSLLSFVVTLLPLIVAGYAVMWMEHFHLHRKPLRAPGDVQADVLVETPVEKLGRG